MVSLQDAPFSASSTWNEQISSGATYTPLNWPASTGYNYSVNWDSYSPSVYVAQSTDPLVTVSYPAGWGYPGGTVSVHMPAAATGAAGTDGELVVIDGNTVYNFWQFNRTGATSATAQSMGEDNIATGSGWGSQSPFLSAGTTAAGSSELAGLLVQAQTDTGSITHALELAVNSTLVKSGAVGQAISSDGSSSTGIVQEGELLGVPPGTQMPAGLSPLGQEVFTALQKYGAYVVDTAGGDTVLRAQANGYNASTITALDSDVAKILPLLESVQGTKSSASTGTTGSTSGSSSGSGSNAGSTGTSTSGSTSGSSTGGTGGGASTGTSSGSSSGSGSNAGSTGTSTSGSTGGSSTGGTGGGASTGTSSGSSSGSGSNAGSTGTSTSGSTGGSSTGGTGGGASTGTSSGSSHQGTHYNPTSSDASTWDAHTWPHNSTPTGSQLAWNSSSNTATAQTLSNTATSMSVQHVSNSASNAGTSSAQTLSNTFTPTGVQQALNSSSNASGTYSSSHHYQDQAVTSSTLQVDDLQSHVNLIHHDFLVM